MLIKSIKEPIYEGRREYLISEGKAMYLGNLKGETL